MTVILPDNIENHHDFGFTPPPKPTYRLRITPTFYIEQVGKIPSRWNQFWMRFLLGWVVEVIK